MQQRERNLRQVIQSFRQTSTNKFYRFKGSNQYTPEELTELVNLIMEVNYEIRGYGRYLWLFQYNAYYYLYSNEIDDFYPNNRSNWDTFNPFEPHDTYDVFPLFSDQAYNLYVYKIECTRTKIETKLNEQGFVFGIKHKLVTEDFQTLVDSFVTNGYLKYRNIGNNLVLYDGKRYNIETLKKFFGFRNKHVHAEDIIVVNSRLKTIEQMTSKTSGQACKMIQCQPAQILLKDIITRNNIPDNYEVLRKILVQLERYAHKKGFIIIPRIMVGIVLYIGTEYTKAKIYALAHSGSSIRTWLNKLFPSKWFPETEDWNQKQPKIQKQIVLSILNKIEPIKKEV